MPMRPLSLREWAACVIIACLLWYASHAALFRLRPSERMPQSAGQPPAVGAKIVLLTLDPRGAIGWIGDSSWRRESPRDLVGWPGRLRDMHRQYEVNWRCYAQLHNYTLVIERDDDAARWRFERNGDLGDAEVWKGSDEGHVDLRSLPAPYSPFWVKVDLLERFLPGADWAVYFDADALFVALPTRFEEVVSQVASPSTDLFVVGSAQLLDSADIVEHTLCAGLFAVRNSPGGWWFVRRWFALRHQDNLWGDQGAFHHAVLEMHLRHNATRSSGAKAPPWYAKAYDSVASPCLRAHWSLSRQPADIRCVGNAMRSLRDRPFVDMRTEWPVAWSSQFGLDLNGMFMRGPWSQMISDLHGNFTRRRSPPLLAHTKTGRKFPLSALYYRNAIHGLAMSCPPAIARADPADFVRGAVFGERTSEWSRSFKTTTPQTPHAFAQRA